MAAKTLRDLFIDELKDVCDAERRLTRALPKMLKVAHTDALQSAFEVHLKQTEEHVRRVEQMLASLDASPAGKTCKAMVGLLEEGDELMKQQASPELKDVMLIAAAQKVEHYEIATYGCLRTWARQLGEDAAAKLIERTLKEEVATDERLTGIAMSLDLDIEDSSEEEDYAMVPANRRPTANAAHKPIKIRTR